ncbi:hypothetical protein I7I48_04930 [Histoplasma ohiense]|nr:hypothetical protein I7I48_04930 [Histoplasma ohiense (nom. inval.)]
MSCSLSHLFALEPGASAHPGSVCARPGGFILGLLCTGMYASVLVYVPYRHVFPVSLSLRFFQLSSHNGMNNSGDSNNNNKKKKKKKKKKQKKRNENESYRG